jgi:hypothetical protein
VFVSSPAANNGALLGVIRGTQLVGDESFSFALMLDESLATSYGSTFSFRVMFRRFVFNSGPLAPRNVWVTLVSAAGHNATYRVRSAATALAPNTWLPVSLTLSEDQAMLSVSFADAVAKRAAYLRILGSIKQCVCLDFFVSCSFVFL